MHAQPLIIPTNHGLVKNLEGSYEPSRLTVATPLTKRLKLVNKKKKELVQIVN